jgi:hypothetical protein
MDIDTLIYEERASREETFYKVTLPDYESIF